MADEKEEKAGASEAKEEQAEAQAAVKPGTSKSLIIILIVAVLVVVVTPLATFLVIKNMMPAPVVEVKENAKPGGQTVLKLKVITMNITGTHGTRILRIEPHLVISEKKLADDLKETSESLLVDRVILAAGRKTMDELEGENGRESLKRDIISEINAAIRPRMSGAVTDVYFNEYLIQ